MASSRTKIADVDDNRITAFGMLLEAQAALVRQLDSELEEAGAVSLQWLEVLLRLGRTPGRALPAGVLGRAVSLTSGATTRLVDRIVAAGLVVRTSSPDDRRVVLVELTEAGLEELARALPRHLSGLEQHFVAPLSRAELDQLESLLRRLRDHTMAR